MSLFVCIYGTQSEFQTMFENMVISLPQKYHFHIGFHYNTND